MEMEEAAQILAGQIQAFCRNYQHKMTIGEYDDFDAVLDDLARLAGPALKGFRLSSGRSAPTK